VIRAFDGERPDVAESAYVDESAVVIGRVTVEAKASVWPGAVIRGDRERIVLREGSNVQDNATLHEDAEIGPYATVGHNAVVHAATVGRRSLIGMGATVLDGSVIGERSIVGANSLVTEDTTVPESVLAAGSPAEVIKDVEDSDWTAAADRYVDLADRYERTAVGRDEGETTDGED
jgi:carbonic anhydrase/acetyltransferase-like protein (isoleucine patch superfamily)